MRALLRRFRREPFSPYSQVLRELRKSYEERKVRG